MTSLVKPLVITLLLLVLAAGCGPGAAPVPTIQSPSPAAASSSTVSGEAWQGEWERLQQAAKREGNLAIYSAMGTVSRDTLIKAAKEKFALNLDIVIGNSAELTAKLHRERLAGLYVPDLWVLGKSGVEQLVSEGILDRLDTQLFLPEVVDKKAWSQGDLPWMDPEQRYQLALLGSPQPPLFINTDLVKVGEVTSYNDLLNPKWKGKIVIQDPSASGAGNAWFTTVAVVIMGVDYLRKLGAQEPIIAKESSLVAEMVARGKYPIGLGIAGEDMVRFKRIGSPVQNIMPKEGTYLSTGSSSLALVSKAPHPNGAKLFINWLLTKEGNTIISRAHGYQSARVDAPADFLEPELVRDPGIKYFDARTWEFGAKQVAMRPVAREIFGLR